MKLNEEVTIEILVMNSFTLLCKVLSGVTLSDKISLNIAVLVVQHRINSSTSCIEIC